MPRCLKYELSIARISICVNNIICYHNMSKWKNWTQMVLMIHIYNLRVLKEHHAESHITRSLRPRISHCKNCMALALRRNSSTFSYLLSWRYENAKDIKLPTKTLRLCTRFIHSFYTFWNTHKIKQWWSYFNTIKVVLILECNFIS